MLFRSVMADNIVKYFDRNFTMINELAAEMRFVRSESKNNDDSLSGTTFCITGTFSQSRDALKAKLESKGAKFVSSVSKNLNILFAGSSAGSKLTKAQSLGIKIADEQELLKMIGD